MTLWDIGDDIYNTITGGKQAAERASDTISKAGETYANQMNELANTQKSAKDLYQEGKETAASSANNKAGIASRNAKASAMMHNGSKLMSAIQGAQASVDASTNGYDNTASNVANLGQSIQSNQNALRSSGYQGQLNADTTAATTKANQAINAANERRKTAATIGSAFIQGLGGN